MRAGGVAALLARPRVRAALVLGLGFALYFGSGSRGATLTGDPVQYAEIGREVVERGDPTRLTFDGRMVARKPPLVFWMEAVSFLALGFTDAAARLPSRLMGLATVALLMALVSRYHGRRAAFWAGLACVTWWVFRSSAASCRLESTLAFFTLASIGAFLRIGRLGPSPLRSLGLGALLGLAILSKGLPAAFPVAGIALGAAISGRGRLLLRTAPLAALGLIAVAGPWFATQVLREGPAWWAQLRADLSRGTAPIHSILPALGLYGTDVFLLAAPWVPALVLGASAAARRIVRSRARALPEALLLSLVASLLVTLPFLPMHYARYFAQVVPAFAWLAGAWLAPAFRRLDQRRRTRRAPAAHRAAAVLLAGAVLVGYPAVVVFGLSPPLDRYGDLRAASRAFRAAAPGSASIPTWSLKQEAGRPDDVPIPLLAASRFYFGLRLVPFDPGDASQPPLVLFRHPDRGPAEAKDFDERHRYAVAWRGDSFTLYRTR